MAATPTAKTLEALRREGYTATVVERWNPHARRRQDLFGFGDILAIKSGVPVLLVQCTTASNHSSRRRKILGLPEALEWLGTGNQIEVWSWKHKPGTRPAWSVRREPITAESFEGDDDAQ